ncbi:helix-turn-helix domain-containing protein [Alcanivorax sp. JB21]|uniref:helix-turn-helix domain-containing protein n=1 Tax=Alcanivorax limicola TaxID=2874102 RepID=UPI001CBF2B4E|nr:helix-turn-helix transcriptional regulator [Alcanivorax limicola]MBZ2188516.1 helix-turn-helix domain-containing protein [Alcanivorax limicola]
MKIGTILRRQRENRFETLEDVAFRAGTDASNLSRIERGLQQPSITLLAQLAAALDTKVSDLYLILEASQPTAPGKPLPNEPWRADLVRLQRHLRELDKSKRAILIDLARALRKY